MTDIEAVLQRIEADLSIYATHRNAIVMTDDVRALIRCARALNDVDCFFRSGNPIPVERATIMADHPYVVQMKDALKKLGELPL